MEANRPPDASKGNTFKSDTVLSESTEPATVQPILPIKISALVNVN